MTVMLFTTMDVINNNFVNVFYNCGGGGDQHGRVHAGVDLSWLQQHTGLNRMVFRVRENLYFGVTMKFLLHTH